MTGRSLEIRELLRQRIASGLHRGTLAPGNRLPSLRQLGAELRATPRTVMAAYASLAREGLVERRRRSGVFIAPATPAETALPQTAAWLVDVMVQGRVREIPPSALSWRIAHLLGAAGLRAAAIAGNTDQADHIARELRTDYGFAAAPVEFSRLDAEAGDGGLIAGVDLLVATALAAIPAGTIARRLGKPLIIVRLRPQLIEEMTSALRRGPVYFVGTDPRFADALQIIFGPTGWSHHLRPVILGRDDPERIPAEAPAYILDLAHERLGDIPLARRVAPILRVFSEDTAAELLRFIVAANLRSGADGTADGSLRPI